MPFFFLPSLSFFLFHWTQSMQCNCKIIVLRSQIENTIKKIKSTTYVSLVYLIHILVFCHREVILNNPKQYAKP